MSEMNKQQLKGLIDQGKTGDKNAEGFDPGMATLGTCEEAAGTPSTPEMVATAAKMETASPKPKQPAEYSANLPTPGYPAVWTVAGAFGAVVLTVLLAAVNGRY